MAIIYLARYQEGDIHYGYIGQTRRSLEHRKREHERGALKNEPATFKQAIKKHGAHNFQWTLLVECDNDKANEWEKKFIHIYGTMPDMILTNGCARSIRINQPNLNIKRENESLGFKSPKEKQKNINLKKLLIEDGRLKPIVNMKTRAKYDSLNEASKRENVSKDKIRKSCNKGKKLEDGTQYAFILPDGSLDIKRGHTLENNYIGKNAKRVKNLVNEKTYDSVNTAAKEYRISTSCIDGCARGKYLICNGQWVFCFLDDEGNELTTDRHLRALEIIKNKDKLKYMAWHVDDIDRKKAKCFKDLESLCNELKITTKSHVKCVCEGKRSHVQKWRIAYLDVDTGTPNLKKTHLEEPKKIIKRVVQVDWANNILGKPFDSCSDAGKKFSINGQQIAMCAQGKLKSVYRNYHRGKGKKVRLRFRYLNDKDEIVKTSRDNEPFSQKGKNRYLVIVNNKEAYSCNSFNEVCRKTGLPPSRVKRYLKDAAINIGNYRIVQLD